MDQLKDQVLLFMEEVEAREMHQIEQSLGEIHILHDDYPTLPLETMRQVGYVLSHVLRVLMNVLDAGSYALLRDILFEDGAVMPLTMSLTLRSHTGERMERCLFVRGMVRFEFKNRCLHDNVFHMYPLADPIGILDSSLFQWNMHNHNISNVMLICYCSFLSTHT